MTDRSTRLDCVSKDCLEDAVKFCITCRQALCPTHEPTHAELVKSLKSPHQVTTVEEYERTTLDENSRYCTEHQKAPIVIACQHCFKTMCAECVDEKKLLEECSSAGIEQHETRSIKQLSQKIQDELSDFTSELKIKEMMVSDGMVGRRELSNEELEVNQNDLERAASKAEELHKLIDDCYQEWKTTLTEHMGRKKGMMDTLETEFGEYQKNCQEIYNQTDQYKKQSDESIVKGRWNIKSVLDEANPLMYFQLSDNPDQFTNLSLKITDDAVKFPVSFQTERPNQPLFSSVRTPTDLEFTGKFIAPSKSNCIIYSHSGSFIHAGQYELSGLEFTPSLPSGMVISLYKHRSSLYVVQNISKTYHVHVVDLDKQSVIQSIITIPSAYWYVYVHMAVTDQYVLIADYHGNTIKAYSTKTYKHMFDISNPSIFKNPYCVAILGDSLLVGERSKYLVVNITISQTPDERWSTSIGVDPRSLQVREDDRFIMVGSPKQIVILSYQGEKLKCFKISECAALYDFSSYKNQLAVTDASSKIKLYEMKLPEFDFMCNLVLIGNSGVGKSCIFHQFCGHEYNDDFKPTLGVEFGTKLVNIGDKTFRIEIWDTPGVERLRSTISDFLRKALAVVLIYDISCRETFDALPDWLNEIRSKSSEDVVIVMIGNKMDLAEDKRQVTYVEASKFARENDLVLLEVSAKTGENIEEAFQKCTRHVFAKGELGGGSSKDMLIPNTASSTVTSDKNDSVCENPDPQREVTGKSTPD